MFVKERKSFQQPFHNFVLYACPKRPFNKMFIWGLTNSIKGPFHWCAIGDTKSSKLHFPILDSFRNVLCKIPRNSFEFWIQPSSMQENLLWVTFFIDDLVPIYNILWEFVCIFALLPLKKPLTTQRKPWFSNCQTKMYIFSSFHHKPKRIIWKCF